MAGSDAIDVNEHFATTPGPVARPRTATIPRLIRCPLFAFWPDPVRDLGVRVRSNEVVHPTPVSGVIPNLLAPGANRNRPRELFRLLAAIIAVAWLLGLAFFQRLKRSRRISTRYEKRALNFLGMILIAAILSWIFCLALFKPRGPDIERAIALIGARTHPCSNSVSDAQSAF
jgi:hypothetical protein